jgi:hypothetical protein
MNSFGRCNDQPNPDCLVCSNDSQTIILCSVKDFNKFTLGDLKEKVLLGFEDCELSPASLMIEFDQKIIYEHDQQMVDDNDPDDEDEIKMNQKRLLKTLADLKFKNQSFL